MPTFRQDTKIGAAVPMMKTDDYNDQSVTKDKIRDGNITSEKLADGAVTAQKLAPSIRQEINDSVTASNEATEKAKEATAKADQATENAKQATVAATAAKEAADTATQLATTATTASVQATEQAKAATTKAEEATAKANEAAQKADDSREQTEQTLGTMQEVIDKTAIKDEEGTVVGTPFRYIQNEEFIFAKVDSEDKLLFGIQWDGTPKFGKTSAVEDRLQSQVTLLAERVATIMGDEDTTNVIDTMNELKKFFAEIENTETLTGILANLDNVAKNLDKTTIKDEEGNVQDTPFRVIENEEFIMAVVDSEDRVLFGIYRATGEPYYPLNEMYHVEQNEEFFALWLDAANHVLLGIRRDGQIIGEIHAVNALKQVISQLQADLESLQEKVGTIDTNLKELLDVFSLQENPEYLAVEQDAEGKILSATNADGSHYIHNAKSETIPTEFEHIEDPEGRAEIIKDKENRIIGFVDSQGDFHANTNVFSKNIDNLQNVSDNFCLSSHHEDVDIVLEEPRIAEVRLYAKRFPSSKTSDIKGKMKFISGKTFFERNVLINLQGATSMTMPKKNISLDIMDSSYSDSLKVRFGDWVSQDSFHLKAYYFDLTKGVAPTAYMLYKQIEESNGFENDRPYKMYKKTILEGGADINDIEDSFNYDALCHPMGFPCTLYWNDEFYGLMSWQLKKHRDNYAMNKKNAKHIHLDGWIDKGTLFGGKVDWTAFEIRNPKSLVCSDGSNYDGENPKELIDDTMPNYDSSNKNHKNTMAVKKSIIAFSKYMSEIDAVIASSPDDTTTIKNAIEERFDVVRFIDYLLFIWATANTDSTAKNWQFLSYDGKKLTVEPYDLDSCWGIGAAMTGNFLSDKGKKYLFGTTDNPLQYIYRYYLTELKERWKVLRDKKIIDAGNINNLYLSWYYRVGFDNIQKELERWNESPCYRPIGLNDSWELTGENYVRFSNISTDWSSQTTYAENAKCKYNNRLYRSKSSVNINHLPTETEYWEDLTFVEGKTYHPNETCFWGYTSFFECKCKTETTSQPFKFYSLYPQELSNGFDSLVRLYRYAKNTINYIDSQLDYKS